MSRRASTLLFALSCSLLVCLPCRAEDAEQKIDLPTVLRLAGAQNLDIQIARQRLKEAEAEKAAATERFFPWIAPGFTYHRRDGVAQAVPSGIISDAHFQSYSPGVTLAGQVDFGDALYRSLAAKQTVRASAEALQTERQATTLAAAHAYFELVRAAALAQVAEQALKSSQEYERQLHEAVGTGIAFKGDELRVQTQTKQYQISLRQQSEAQVIASAELARVLRLDPLVRLTPDSDTPVRLQLIALDRPTSDLVHQALSTRPELREWRALTESARQNRKGAVYGPLIPTLSAQVFGGGLGGGPDSAPDHFGAEGDYLVGLTWRIGPGGLLDPAKTHAADTRLAVAELTQLKVKDVIRTEVVQAEARVKSLSDQIVLAEGKVNAASETLRLTQERKQFGVGAVLEEIQAQQELERARADLVNAIADYDKAQYALSRAIGGLADSAQPKGEPKN